MDESAGYSINIFESIMDSYNELASKYVQLIDYYSALPDRSIKQTEEFLKLVVEYNNLAKKLEATIDALDSISKAVKADPNADKAYSPSLAADSARALSADLKRLEEKRLAGPSEEELKKVQGLEAPLHELAEQIAQKLGEFDQEQNT
ncbi:MAG: hypothetical protein FWG30_07195 [Eubacteriaceae bacterium]|jgi:hypothetical protein|nr:hypothetical protein [Eubacteriaceae bacterium]